MSLVQEVVIRVENQKVIFFVGEGGNSGGKYDSSVY